MAISDLRLTVAENQCGLVQFSATVNGTCTERSDGCSGMNR